jgi:hypothetical protein
MEDLANFITVCKETNPLKKVKILGFSAKGNAILASQGKPCLLLLAKQCVEDPVIAIVPDNPAPVMPVASSTPTAEVRSYVRSTQVEHFLPTEKWILEASKIILPISTNGQLQKWRNDPDGLRRKSKLLAEKVLARYQDSFRQDLMIEAKELANIGFGFLSAQMMMSSTLMDVIYLKTKRPDI